jgi:hypothetical protein
MEKREVKQENQFQLKLDVKGNIEISGNQNLSPESSEIIKEALQQAEYYRLRTKEETASINEHTFILSGVFILATAFMILSVSNAIIGSFKNHNQPQTEVNQYVREHTR